ncbi:DUF6163 family protein [Nitratireductor alexandrii]|uniref:DUF6163 family protein n=1 Tax=Nitratireductor alexandrii TaxID=2448161 RepID=UPI000FDC54C5|nr:DUF6163 family protein [Nitratireductor alexandrii]
MSEDGVDVAAWRPGLVEAAFPWFLRIVAAYSLMFGVAYWVRLIGYYDGPLWRFDTMSVEWQVASVSLSVLFPFAGIGLWMTASWGPVIWFLCAAMETTMYWGFPDMFGHRPLIAVSHLLVALIYIAFRVGIALQRRNARID